MNDMTKTPALIDTPAIGITVQNTVDEGRAIVFQGFIPADCADADLNALLDKLMRASDRQSARARLPKALKELATRKKAFARAAEDIFRLDSEAAAADAMARDLWVSSGKRGEWQMNPKQKHDHELREGQRANAMTTHARNKQDIELVEEEIAELERVIAAEG